jgi:cytoskeletal protein CcmA (bactofilin family)
MFGKKWSKPVAIQTLIGEDARIQGDLVFSGGCHVDGVINGAVKAERDDQAFLSISEHGCVEGNVTVPILALSGAVKGDVYVSERAELGATARVTGNVYYNLFEIAAGAEINGKLIHRDPHKPGQASPEQKVVRPKVVPNKPAGQEEALLQRVAAKQSG